jgi:hypothetical protein
MSTKEQKLRTMIPESLKQNKWTEIDWLYIQGLSKAIENVDKKYIFYFEDDNKSRFHVERVFSYELYSKWNEIIKENGMNPENLMLNAELKKHYYDMGQFKFPDMVLHGDYTTLDKQFIICEIKSSRNYIKTDSLKKDMESLMNGMNALSYSCGVFIYIGNNTNSIVARLRNILQNPDLNYGEKRILFIGLNGLEAPCYILL